MYEYLVIWCVSVWDFKSQCIRCGNSVDVWTSVIAVDLWIFRFFLFLSELPNPFFLWLSLCEIQAFTLPSLLLLEALLWWYTPIAKLLSMYVYVLIVLWFWNCVRRILYRVLCSCCTVHQSWTSQWTEEVNFDPFGKGQCFECTYLYARVYAVCNKCIVWKVKFVDRNVNKSQVIIKWNLYVVLVWKGMSFNT